MRHEELNRSWLRRGMWAPSPWARTMNDVMLETELAIVRWEAAPDEFHGFEADESVPLTVWTPYAHIDQISEQADDQVLSDGGFHTTTRWEIFVPVPWDEANWPVKGDLAAWRDSSGQPVEVMIDSVTLVDANLPDHLEIMAVEAG